MNAIEVKKLTLSYITSKYSDTINAIETEIRKAAESCKFTVVYKNFSSVAEIEAMVNYFKANGFLTDWDINMKSLIIFWNCKYDE